MKKMNNKGFTLVELLAVIVILITIMAIAVPTINSSLERNKENQNVQRMKVLESAVLEYINDNVNNNKNTLKCINLDDLLSKGYIKKDDKMNADGEELNGCIKYDSNTQKFTFFSYGNGESETIISNVLKIGDYVSYTPTSTSYTTVTSKTGDNTITINPSELNVWRVIQINDDKTVDVISEYVSSEAVYFSGETGYRNFVGYLNTLAAQYKNDTYTSKTRYFGYNGQTEEITEDMASHNNYFSNPAPWTCTTGVKDCDVVESKGGGDKLYTKDYDLVKNINALVANKVGTTTATSYWMASRRYIYSSSTVYYWVGSSVKTSGETYINLFYYNNKSGLHSRSDSNALRPIVTLNAYLRISGGDGTSTNPYKLST